MQKLPHLGKESQQITNCPKNQSQIFEQMFLARVRNPEKKISKCSTLVLSAYDRPQQTYIIAWLN